MLVIKPVGGLCNYLRVIFSYLSKAKKLSEKLTVIWIKTEHCPSYFNNYFEEIENVTFSYNNNHNLKIDYQGFDIHNEFPPDYSQLKLLPKMLEILEQKQKILGDFIAVHIRRTDHIRDAKAVSLYTSDEDFINFINKEIENKNLYIATDNLVTYNYFKQKYDKQVKFDYHNVTKRLRQTSLHDAIIDLYMCVYANKFMGSGWSSFSVLIDCLRQSSSQLSPVE